jgi:hypothetical protein
LTGCGAFFFAAAVRERKAVLALVEENAG